MQLSIAFQTDKTPQDYIALAQLVDQYAFDVVSVYADAPYQPSFPVLMLMAQHIHKARLGVAAVSPARMSPIDMAGNISLLAQAAAGGAYLGIARGAWLTEHGIGEPDKPISAIREAIEIIKLMLSGESVAYQGEVYHVASHVRAPYPLPSEPIPILVGTWGKKLAKIAGELADEVKIGGSANPAIVPVMRNYIAEGERVADRPMGSVGVVIGAVTVADEDRQTARKMARREVALYLPVVAALDPTIDIEPELLTSMQIHVQRQELEHAANLISDDVLDTFAFSGNAQDLIEQAEALRDAGASRVEFGTPHGIDPIKGIKILGEQVLPALA